MKIFSLELLFWCVCAFLTLTALQCACDPERPALEIALELSDEDRLTGIEVVGGEFFDTSSETYISLFFPYDVSKDFMEIRCFFADTTKPPLYIRLLHERQYHYSHECGVGIRFEDTRIDLENSNLYNYEVIYGFSYLSIRPCCSEDSSYVY
ncbi:MAG: hypothetical protein AAF734_04880 [Bacteroidota bacterium]